MIHLASGGFSCVIVIFVCNLEPDHEFLYGKSLESASDLECMHLVGRQQHVPFVFSCELDTVCLASFRGSLFITLRPLSPAYNLLHGIAFGMRYFCCVHLDTGLPVW